MAIECISSMVIIVTFNITFMAVDDYKHIAFPRSLFGLFISRQTCVSLNMG